MIERLSARSSAGANIHVTLWLTSVATGTLPAAVDKPDRGNWPCAYINIIVSFYTSACSGHVLRVPHPSGINTDSRPLKETALRCRNAQISHPDHPRTMYLLTDVDPKLLIHVDSCMYMYVKKAATWESRATLSMKSGFVGSRRSLALGASDSSTASLPFRAPGKLRDGFEKKKKNDRRLSAPKPRRL